jgi:hypothetical protein
MAGAPLDVIERLSTPETISLAHQFRARNETLSKGSPEAEDLLRLLGATLEREIGVGRSALLETARRLLPRYLIFGAGGVRALLTHLLTMPAPITLTPRNARAGDRERHLLLYLQRICAKADTFSEFGPTGWGKIDNHISGLKIAIQPGITARAAFHERWTAHATAAVMNADPEIFPELSPRLNPGGRIEDQTFVHTEDGHTTPVSPEEAEILKRCDGRTFVRDLRGSAETIRGLVKKNILRCEIEVPALEPRAFEVLCDDVAKWPASPAREKWLSTLRPIAGLPRKFVAAKKTTDRQSILNEAQSRFQSLGIAHKPSDRFLYSATNPICEECFRESGFLISEDLINEVAIDAAPWIDLWRDSFAFIASRVAIGLRRILEMASPKEKTIPLPAFLRACAVAKLPLEGPGLIAPAVMAFQEVKAAFRERLRPHSDAGEYELTPDDCHIVRQNFQYPRFDEYTYPSADLQIAAESIEAVARGEYQWILAELHPPAALLQHCMYWACPDKATLHDALARTVAGKPNFHFGFFAADFTAHTAVHLFDALPELSYFVAPQRPDPAWRIVPPAETEVYVDETSGDVCLRKARTHDYLGSFARGWIIPLGFHPFQFGLAPETPRLRCGRVVVQRRTWTVTREELPAGNYTGVSRDLILAIERLRAQRNLPRFIYIRPTEQALRRSGAEGRDKDTKPVFVDLESYLFLEIFYRWLTKSGELEATEMLPDPDHLLWREPDGRRTFELRTLIVPRNENRHK